MKRIYQFEFLLNGRRRSAVISARNEDEAYELLYARYPEAKGVDII